MNIIIFEWRDLVKSKCSKLNQVFLNTNLLVSIIFFILLILFLNSCATVQDGSNNNSEKKTIENSIPPQIRFIRIYGEDNEAKPPILVIRDPANKYLTSVGYNYLTLEFDISASITPALYIKYTHCDVNWNETENAFLQNTVNYRTTLIDWSSSAFQNDYYSYRGKVQIPGPTVRFEYSGNWKAQIFEIGAAENPIAESRFFIVKPQTNCRLDIYTAFYNIAFKVTNTGFILEAGVSTKESFLDDRMNTAVFYRNNRWFEPFVSTNSSNVKTFEELYNFKLQSMISGFGSYEKRFRLEGIPAENVYRVLEMTNPALFPRGNDPIRIPFSDIARNGNYLYRDDDGLMNTYYIASSNDDYVNVEFVLDPEGILFEQDVFISGSFNNWNPDRSWQMFYDEKDRFYKCRNMIRRARHNYLYGTGRYNPDTRKFSKFSFDYYEGNTAYSAHTFYGFIYYRQIELGGYDSIIGVVSGNIYGDVRK
jgi:hypothetical protein